MTAVRYRARVRYLNGYTASREGRKAEAVLHYQQALADYEAAGYELGALVTRIALCRCYTALGMVEQAAAVLPGPQETPLPCEGWRLSALAHLQEAQGDYAGALASCRAALPLLVSGNLDYDDEAEWLDVLVLTAELLLLRRQDHIAARSILPILRKFSLAAGLRGRMAVLEALLYRGGESTDP